MATPTRAVFHSRIPAVNAAAWSALGTGLAAAGQEYAARVRTRLEQGYTTGDFVTGHVANSVAVSPVERTGEGLRLTVGSPVNYALFWELGHVNIFSRSGPGASSLAGNRTEGTYQRVEVWRPILAESREALREVIRATAAAEVQGMVGGTGSGLDALTGLSREAKRAAMRRVVSGP